MRLLNYDLVVVGAGPAGLSTALSASKNGISVLCLEKKSAFGEEVRCGEAIGTYLFSRLPFSIPKNLLEWKINGIDFNYGNFKVRRMGKLWEAYSINRSKFEKWLAKKVISSGVKLLTSCEVFEVELSTNCEIKKLFVKNTVTGETSIFTPRKVVAADGLNSKISLLIGNEAPVKGEYMEVYSKEFINIYLKEPNFEQFFFDESIPNCFFYIFPKSNNSANVGIGGFEDKEILEKYFYHFIKKRLRKQFKGAVEIADKSKTAPFHFPYRFNQGNIYFVGDSANQNVKPFIEGLLPSVICGTLLGSIIPKNKMLSNYSKLAKETVPEVYDSSIINDTLFTIFNLEKKTKYLLLIGVVADIFNPKDIEKYLYLPADELRKKLAQS